MEQVKLKIEKILAENPQNTVRYNDDMFYKGVRVYVHVRTCLI